MSTRQNNARITPADSTKEKTMIGKLFQHFKGGVYRVIEPPKDSHNESIVRLIGYAGEKVVWYQSTKDGQIWVRSLYEWNEFVEVDGKSIPRFNAMD